MRALAAALLVLGAASVAHAHVRPAALTAIGQRPDGSLVLGATWGLAFRDAGEWTLGCAAAFGVDADIEDAQLALDGAGTIVLGTRDGLFESSDGCHFTQPTGPLAEDWVIDVVPDGAGGVYAALSRVFGQDQVYHRGPGEPWVPVGEPLDGVLIAQLHATATELWRLVAQPITAEEPRRLFLERSEGGASWERWEIPLVGTEVGGTLLAAREGELHLSLRHLDGDPVPQRVLRFDLATGAFDEVHRAPLLDAGAWTEEGLWVIGRLGGLSFSSDGRAFETVHDVAGRCLGIVDGALAACLDPERDGMALARVTRDAVVPIVRLAAFDSLRDCPPESDGAAVCPAFREALAEDVQVPVDGVPPPGQPGGGCGCALLTRERAPRMEGALALVLLLLQRRRRRPTKARAAPTRAKP